ncbi:MAG TPA: hypothetical protein VFZ76_13395 [Anaerolineales bacterium]
MRGDYQRRRAAGPGEAHRAVRGAERGGGGAAAQGIGAVRVVAGEREAAAARLFQRRRREGLGTGLAWETRSYPNT